MRVANPHYARVEWTLNTSTVLFLRRDELYNNQHQPAAEEAPRQHQGKKVRFVFPSHRCLLRCPIIIHSSVRLSTHLRRFLKKTNEAFLLVPSMWQNDASPQYSIAYRQQQHH